MKHLKMVRDTDDRPGASVNIATSTEHSLEMLGDDAEVRSVAREGNDIADLSGSNLYLNRELTWLEFNKRVLNEAKDSRTPLLERLKFLAIVGSNLDEFFMKRIGRLKQKVDAGLEMLTVDGRSPQQQIDESSAVVREIEQEKDRLYHETVDALKEYGIGVLNYNELTGEEREVVRDYYLQNIFPLVTPQSIDPAHPFPFISNNSLNLLVTVRPQTSNENLSARVKVPIGLGIPRFLKVGDDDKFIALDEVMRNNLDLLFPGAEIVACEAFHVARNARTERKETGVSDLLAMIASEVRDRRFAPIVRVVIEENMDSSRRGWLAAELGLSEDDVFETTGPVRISDLSEIASLNYRDLRDDAFRGVDHPALDDNRSIFHILREAGSILLHHPYVSFSSSVERFLVEASRDPKVRAIKMSLYRTSEKTRIVNALIQAAQNGKQVAVVVELKARFDESANIEWANRMEEAGIHVSFGVLGLKTHSKVILVVRQDYNGLRRYVHIGTGNYHAGTAKLYSDLGLMTCDDKIGEDVTELFNFLTTGLNPERKYGNLVPAPKQLKSLLLERIEREIVCNTKAVPGLIRLKTNALEDHDIVRALYRASQAGVKIDLIVRDTCRLRPGLPGISENITVRSIVGRFLEHSRIYYFQNGGNEEFYIGSADLMRRNLESRVEVMARIDSLPLRQELAWILKMQMADNRLAWEMDSDGSYTQLRQEHPEEIQSCQQLFIRYASERVLSDSGGRVSPSAGNLE